MTKKKNNNQFDGLTAKQRLFVESYLQNSNGTEAARLAGYSGNDDALAVRASRLLKNPKIHELISQRVEKEIIAADDVLKAIKTIALNAEEKASDRLRALELLGKHLMLFTEKQTHEHTGAVSIEVEWIEA
jgi:phage terminase small subunit